MRKKQTTSYKGTKDDLVRLFAVKFLGAFAFTIADEQLEEFCADYCDYRLKPRTDDNYQGDYHYKPDGTFKDDLQMIINKYTI